LSSSALDTPLPTPTVTSVEPGIYLEGETGVRIEDLVVIDAAAGRLEQLTRFPRDVLALPGLARAVDRYNRAPNATFDRPASVRPRGPGRPPDQELLPT
jgi:hypothetical protein